MIRKLWSELPVLIVVAGLLFLVVVGVNNCSASRQKPAAPAGGTR